MNDIVIFFLFFLIAFLYAAVGHGGASGYLAIMALLGFSAVLIKPTALLLNVMVSLIAFVSFYKARHFRVNLLIPLVMASIPFAYLGSTLPVSELWYKKILGVVLLLSIIRLVALNNEKPLKSAPQWYVLGFIGASIGLVSGMIGMGGGILLSPVLLLMGWSTQKQTAAISALFIFLNSLAGIAGQLRTGFHLVPQTVFIMGFVLAGAVAGAYFGAAKLPSKYMKYLLATVLVLAAAKLIFVK